MPDRPGLTETVCAASPPDAFPDWFTRFLQDRQTRKPSAHTMKAYRQDFTAIASLITAGQPASMNSADISRDSIRAAFATYAQDHEAATIRRCWSTWNVLCNFLFTSELIPTNPMQLVGRPKMDKPLPKALPRTAVAALLDTVDQDRDSHRRTDWAERDLAIILTALLAGLRADELRQANIGDIRPTDHGAAVIQVKGKGRKPRSVPIESELLTIIDTYLDSRLTRCPGTEKRSLTTGSGLTRWPAHVPLFVGRDGERITRGTLQSRIKRAFKRAGPTAHHAPGAMIHGLRHTYATELANSDVSVYTLMKLLGHESMATSQRYVTAAGVETRSSAARNPIYALVSDRSVP